MQGTVRMELRAPERGLRERERASTRKFIRAAEISNIFDSDKSLKLVIYHAHHFLFMRHDTYRGKQRK